MHMVLGLSCRRLKCSNLTCVVIASEATTAMKNYKIDPWYRFNLTVQFSFIRKSNPFYIIIIEYDSRLVV